MPYSLVQGTISSAVANTKSMPASYPVGFSRSNFGSYTGHKLCVGQAVYDQTKFSLELGSSYFKVINNSGVTWPAGESFLLEINDQLDSSGVQINADGGLSVNTTASSGLRFLQLGDSLGEGLVTQASVGPIVANGDETLQVTTNTAHGSGIGDKIRLTATPSQDYNLMDGSVSGYIDTTNIVAPIRGRKSVVTANGSAGIISYVYRNSCRGAIWWAQFKIGDPFKVTNCAVPGASIEDVTQFLDQTDTSAGYDVLHIIAGMNNIYSKGDSLAVMQAKMTTLLAKAKPLARYGVVSLVPPRNSADSAWTSGRQTIHTGFNRWLYEYARSQGFRVLDTSRVQVNNVTYVNAGATNPDPSANMIFDNTHPSMPGAIAWGFALADILVDLGLATYGGWKGGHADHIGANAGNLLTNADFSSVTTNVATGWGSTDITTNMSVTPSTEDRTVANDGDAAGKNQVFTINYGTATGTASQRFRKDNIQSLFTVGKKYQIRVGTKLTGATGLTGFDLQLFLTITGGGVVQISALNPDSNADAYTGDLTGWLITPEFIWPDNVSDADLWVRTFITSAQSGNMVVKYFKPEILEVLS